MKVLLTGVTGTLGRALLPPLRSAGHDVRGLSRAAHPSDGAVEWVRGDLRTGEGLDFAVSGVAAIVHAATYGGLASGKTRLRYIYRHPGHTDVEGTRRLVDAAKSAGVARFIYPSIVGIDRVPIGYWGNKLGAEKIIASSGVAYTLARITQFHELVDVAIRYALRSPLPMMARSQQVQPIDVGDAARLVAPLVAGPPANGVVEFGGPEVTTYGEAADAWLADRGLRRRVRSLPMPGRIGPALVDGALCTEDRSGKITWGEWLRAHPKEAS